MLSFLLAPPCNDLQTPAAAHTKECLSGVEGIIKMPCFSSRPMFISKAPVCEYLCMSLWSCSVSTGSCPNLVMGKSEAHEEKGGDVMSIAAQPRRTHRSPCLAPSAGGDNRSSKLAPQDSQSGLQVQVMLYGMFVSVPGEPDGWVFGLVICKVFRASSISKCLQVLPQAKPASSLCILARAAGELSFCGLTSPFPFFCRWKRLRVEGQPTACGPWHGHPILVPSDPVPPLLISCLVQQTPLPKPSSPAASPSSHCCCGEQPSLVPDPCPMPAPKNPSEGLSRRMAWS